MIIPTSIQTPTPLPVHLIRSENDPFIRLKVISRYASTAMTTIHRISTLPASLVGPAPAPPTPKAPSPYTTNNATTSAPASTDRAFRLASQPTGTAEIASAVSQIPTTFITFSSLTEITD